MSKIIGITVGTPISPNKVIEKADNVIPTLLLDTELTEEVSSIIIEQYNGLPFYCNELTVRLDIPKTTSVAYISTSIKRKNNTFLGLNNQHANLQTVAQSDTTNIHTMAIVKAKLHSNVYVDIDYSGKKSNNSNEHFNTQYPNLTSYAMSKSLGATNFEEDGTSGIKISLSNSVMLPIGTKIQVWGCIQQ